VVTEEASESSAESKESHEKESDERELEREWWEPADAGETDKVFWDFWGMVEGNWFVTGVVQVGARSS
jgi:hypothetical protein